MNLTLFSTLGSTHTRRETSVGGLDSTSLTSGITSAGGGIISSAETSVAQASTAVQTAGSEVNKSVQEISNALKSNLPGYYTVGLLGYCEGYDDKATYCSHPSTSFYFNMTSLFSKASPETLDLIPGIGSKALRGYQSIAQWSISANILGLIFTSATVLFGITTMIISRGRVFLVISHLVCSSSQLR